MAEGLSYQQIAARTQSDKASSVSKSAVHKLATQGTPDGKVPLSVPQLRALAKAINQPWDVVKEAVLGEARMSEVAQSDGANVVVARAREDLTPAELEVWASMAEDLIKLVREQRRRR